MNNKGPDQTAYLYRLIWALLFTMHKPGFLMMGLTCNKT